MLQSNDECPTNQVLKIMKIIIMEYKNVSYFFSLSLKLKLARDARANGHNISITLHLEVL